jgi:iron complex outermembrane receptor protein
VRFTDPQRVGDFVSGFVQDEITLLEKLRLYLGTKAEYNSYTGFEIQPGARLAWFPTTNHTLWASVARAVRTPSRADDDLSLDVASSPQDLTAALGFPVTGIIQIRGQRNFTSEDLLALEGGWRWTPLPTVSLDSAVFYNFYDDLRSVEYGSPSVADVTAAFIANFMTGLPQAVVVPAPFDNLYDGETYGAEMSANWQALDWWRLGLSYSWIQLQLAPDEATVDYLTDREAQGSTPEQMVHLKSQIDLPYGVEVDATVSYIDSLTAPHVNGYVRLDGRIGWTPIKNLQIDLVGQNLTDGQHEEFGSQILGVASKVERSVFGKVTWRY